MKNIFDLIEPEKKQKTQPPKQQTPPQTESPKTEPTYMQKLIAEGKESLYMYDIIPTKKYALSMVIKKGLRDNLVGCYNDGNKFTEFLNYVRLAKHKRMHISKVKINTKYQYESYIFNPLEYVLLNLSKDTDKMSRLARYIFASDSKFLSSKNLQDAMHALLQFSPQNGRHLLRSGDHDFIKLYKLLIDKGASGKDVVEMLFDGVGYNSFLTEDPNIIEMFLYENDPLINKKIFTAFYNCENPQTLYPILEKYGFEPNLLEAIANLRHENGPDTLRFLIKTGKIDRSDLTSQKASSAILMYDIEGYDMTKIYHCVEQIAQETNLPEKPKKISEKTSIKATTKTTSETEQKIEEIFDAAVKNIEQQ